MKQVTVKEYAAQIGMSISTARKRLEEMRVSGKAQLSYRWEQFKMPRACRGIKQPPAHRVAVYTISADQ